MAQGSKKEKRISGVTKGSEEASKTADESLSSEVWLVLEGKSLRARLEDPSTCSFKFLWQNHFIVVGVILVSHVNLHGKRATCPVVHEVTKAVCFIIYVINVRSVRHYEIFSDSNMSQQGDYINNLTREFLANIHHPSCLSPKVSGKNAAGLHIKTLQRFLLRNDRMTCAV